LLSYQAAYPAKAKTPSLSFLVVFSLFLSVYKVFRDEHHTGSVDLSVFLRNVWYTGHIKNNGDKNILRRRLGN